MMSLTPVRHFLKHNLILITVFMSLHGSAQVKLPHTSGNPDDGFGRSVTIEADTIIVGAPYIGINGAEAGAAYVYDYDGMQWSQSQILLPAGVGAGDYFGYSVALSGDYCMVGATGDAGSGFLSGAVYMYRFDGVSWNLDQKITDPSGNAWDEFGAAVAVSGDDAFIGVPGNDGTAANAGAVFIYQYDGTSWSYSQTLTGVSEDDAFGKSVSVDGAWAAIGAYGDDTAATDSGAVHIYQFTGASWVPFQTIKAGDAGAQDYFGLSVALDGQQLLVGAPYDNDNGADSGSVYVFAFDNGSWIQQEKIRAGDGSDNHLYGYSLDISRKYAVVGAANDNQHGTRSGAAYLLFYNERTWVELLKFTASDPTSYLKFGTSVALTESCAVAGAPRDLGAVNESGAAYVFEDVSSYKPIPSLGIPGLCLLLIALSGLMIKSLRLR